MPASLGTGLTNSVVGIIGCGNIGIAVVNLLSGFKLNELLYTSRKKKSEGIIFGVLFRSLIKRFF